MRRLKLTAATLAACLLGAALALPAQAQHRHGHGPRTHGHIGLNIGIPLGWPYWGWYPYPYHYPPYPAQVVVAPAEPTVYIERPSAPEPAAYWYYCAESGAYYPYVRECQGGWQRVAPRPPGE